MLNLIYQVKNKTQQIQMVLCSLPQQHLEAARVRRNDHVNYPLLLHYPLLPHYPLLGGLNYSYVDKMVKSAGT